VLCVEHARVARRPELALGPADLAIPEDDVARFDLAKVIPHLLVEVEGDHPRELEGLVYRKPGGLERIPGQDEPLGKRVKVVLPLDRVELIHPPPFDLATGRVQRVLGTDGVEIEVFVGDEVPVTGLLNGMAPLKGPILTKHLEGRSKRSLVEVHADDNRFLELGYPEADGFLDTWFDRFPVNRVGV
jgi:hypothetical protein